MNSISRAHNFLGSIVNIRFDFHILRTARGFWKYCKKGGGVDI